MTVCEVNFGLLLIKTLVDTSSKTFHVASGEYIYGVFCIYIIWYQFIVSYTLQSSF
jgi:hypothetical protein